MGHGKDEENDGDDERGRKSENDGAMFQFMKGKKIEKDKERDDKKNDGPDVSGFEQRPSGLEDELFRGGREDAAVHDEEEERQFARGDDLPRTGIGRAHDLLRDVSRRHGAQGVGTCRRSGVRRSCQLPCRFVEVADEPVYLTGRIRELLKAGGVHEGEAYGAESCGFM